ncbi:hypothetical protein BT69DRAFT_1276301, partial [Atractiella rhizophila]
MPSSQTTSSVGIPDEIRLEMPAARDIKRIGQVVEFHFGSTNSNFSNLDLDQSWRRASWPIAAKSSIIDHNKRNNLDQCAWMEQAMIHECYSSPSDHHTCDNAVPGL